MRSNTKAGIRVATRARAVDESFGASESLNKVILESSLDCIVIIDHEGRIAEFNPAAEATFGHKREAVLGRAMADLLIPPRWREAHERRFANYLATGVGHSLGKRMEVDALRTDGTEFPVELGLAVIRAGPKPLFAGFIRDLTERRRAEDSLRRFRVAMDHSVDMVLLIDRKTMRYVDFNPAVCRLLGYSREELLGMGPQDVLPASRASLEKSYDALIANPTARGGMDSYYICKDGSHLPFESTRHVLRSGDTWLIAAISRDIRERKAAERKIGQLNRVYAVLSGINAAIVRIREREELFREVCRIATEAGGFEAARIVELEADGRARVAAAIDNDLAKFEAIVEEYNRDPEGADSLLALAIRSGSTIVSNDAATDPRVSPRHLAGGETFALARLPITVGGRRAAVLVLRASEAGMFDAEEMKLLNELAGDISFALDHIEKEKRLDYLALYDSLTGLANRTLFVERLNQSIHSAAQSGGKFAVALFDIERLRTINESLGRQAGDALLKEVAARLARAAGKSDAARVGADHFVTMLPSVKGRSQVARMVQSIARRCFGEPFLVEGNDLRIAAKAGIAMFPGDGSDAETLIRHAESALRKGKRIGEPFTFFSKELVERSAGALTLENKLRQALEKEEFVLHYQPKVDALTGRTNGVEALVRWASPELGLVPPMQFIPLMEETGLILQVGSWALAKAAADHRKWVEMRLPAPRIAVNLSAIQLRRADFVETLKAITAGGASPMGIDLELTETLVMEDIEGTVRKLNAARDLGASIAIDDFGTGYSSLAYLARLPVQTLKIDRSFVVTMLENADTMALVQTIISLAHSLRLKVVAEGVDDEAQARVLRLLRCDEMQGYLFSKPVPFEEMTALLKQV